MIVEKGLEKAWVFLDWFTVRWRIVVVIEGKASKKKEDSPKSNQRYKKLKEQKPVLSTD
jgi:hypothetical protein